MDIRIIIGFFIHLDKYLMLIIDKFGIYSYLILFLIIFAETGFVVTPFLPGDSIIFAAGTFTAMGSFNIIPLYLILVIAAILGDTINYWIGHKIGPEIFRKDTRFIKKEHLEKTKAFYEKHGGKTIILARFIPIVRTFAPFVAGVGLMNYTKFLIFNITGGVLWVSLFLFLGYFFGNIKFVKDNFELTVLFIILVSVVPVITEFIKSRKKFDEVKVSDKS
jgi:membrane-associated protein